MFSSSYNRSHIYCQVQGVGRRPREKSGKTSGSQGRTMVGPLGQGHASRKKKL